MIEKRGVFAGRAQFAERDANGICDGVCSDRRSEPGTWLSAQEVAQSLGSRCGDDGKACRCCFQQSVWHAFITRGKDEERGLSEVVDQIASKSGKAHGLIDAEMTREMLQIGLERPITKNG